MGRKPQARESSLPGYRDDPDALSLHTNPESSDPFDDTGEAVTPSSSSIAESSSSNIGSDNGSDISNVDTLPSYEASEAIESTSRQNEARASAVAGLHDQYTVIDIGGSGRSTSQFFKKKSTNKEVSARMDERLSEPEELYKYVSDYLQWAQPRPIVWIEGWHWVEKRQGGGNNNNNKKSRERETDFQIMLSLQPYLGAANSSEWRQVALAGPTDNVLRGSWRKQRAPGVRSDLEVGADEENRDLRAWCEHFSADKSKLKIFRLSRTVSGLNEDYIKNSIETAIRATHYRGHIETHVVTEDRAVDIYSEHWINRIRTSWLRYLFYFTFLWIFTWPIVFLRTRRWRVITVDWPFSLPWPERGQDARRYATISERDWLSRHQQLIQELAVERFQGNATYLDVDADRIRRRAAANSSGNAVPGHLNRSPSTGNQNVDSAIGFIQAGVAGLNSFRNQASGRGSHDWGWDE